MWEKNLKKSGYMYMSNWFTLFYGRNWQTILNQLYPNKNFKNFFEKKKPWKKKSICVHMHVCVLSHFSRVQLFVTPWTVAHQVPLSMELSRQEYWSGLPCPPSGDLPHLGIEPVSACVSCIAGGFFTHWATWKAHLCAEDTHKHVNKFLA